MARRVNHRIAPSLKRKGDARKPKQNVLIVCEGEETEPNYLIGWAAANELNRVANVRIVGMGESTGRLVMEAEALNRERQRRVGHGYDQIWLVMDKDDNEDFDVCITEASRKGYKVAWTNNAFEWWLCLHFNFLQSRLTRDGYIANLESAMRRFVPGFQYQKADKNIYAWVQKYGDEQAAEDRARKLMEDCSGLLPSKCEPGTTMPELLKALREIYSEV